LRNLGTDLGGAVRGFKEGMKTEDDKPGSQTSAKIEHSGTGQTIEGEVKDKSKS